MVAAVMVMVVMMMARMAQYATATMRAMAAVVSATSDRTLTRSQRARRVSPPGTFPRARRRNMDTPTKQAPSAGEDDASWQLLLCDDNSVTIAAAADAAADGRPLLAPAATNRAGAALAGERGVAELQKLINAAAAAAALPSGATSAPPAPALPATWLSPGAPAPVTKALRFTVHVTLKDHQYCLTVKANAAPAPPADSDQQQGAEDGAAPADAPTAAASVQREWSCTCSYAALAMVHATIRSMDDSIGELPPLPSNIKALFAKDIFAKHCRRMEAFLGALMPRYIFIFEEILLRDADGKRRPGIVTSSSAATDQVMIQAEREASLNDMAVAALREYEAAVRKGAEVDAGVRMRMRSHALDLVVPAYRAHIHALLQLFGRLRSVSASSAAFFRLSDEATFVAAHSALTQAWKAASAAVDTLVNDLSAVKRLLFPDAAEVASSGMAYAVFERHCVLAASHLQRLVQSETLQVTCAALDRNIKVAYKQLAQESATNAMVKLRHDINTTVMTIHQLRLKYVRARHAWTPRLQRPLTSTRFAMCSIARLHFNAAVKTYDAARQIVKSLPDTGRSADEAADFNSVRSSNRCADTGATAPLCTAVAAVR